MPEDNVKRNSYAPTTIGKVLMLLECFSIEQPRVTAIEIGMQLGLTTSTLYRYLSAMENEGYLEREPGTNYYVIGLRVVELAGIALGRMEVRRHGQAEIDALSNRLKMNANLGVLYRGDTFHLCYSVQTEVDQMYTIIGRRTPAHCTAMGKVMLAHLPREEAQAYVQNFGFRTLTGNSISNHLDLDLALDEVVSDGYAVDRGEVNEWTYCVAAPVREQGGKVIAAISVSTSKEKIESNLKEIAKEVSAHARRLSVRLGHYDKYFTYNDVESNV
jgi:DNA-binding IclR family transcriptional regulator